MAKNYTHKDFCAAVRQAQPGASPDHLRQIACHARTLHAACERCCNGHHTWKGDWDEKAAERDDRLVDKRIAQINALAAKMGARAYIPTDPRGVTVLYWPGMTGYDDPKADGGWNGIAVQ